MVIMWTIIKNLYFKIDLKNLYLKGGFNPRFYSYSSNKKDNCSLSKPREYKEVFSNSIIFTNTLISNLIKVLIYKNEFNKVYFTKKFGYMIFEID